MRAVVRHGNDGDEGALLVVAGRRMNSSWVQLWTVLGAALQGQGKRIVVLTARDAVVQNLYFDLFGFARIYIDDVEFDEEALPPGVISQVKKLRTLSDFRAFTVGGTPAGEMALSTWGRQRATGLIALDQGKTRAEVRSWLLKILQVQSWAKRLYEEEGIDQLFCTEIFMEEYGGVYYAALECNLNIVRFAGTVRDDAIVVQHMTRQSDRRHFASLSEQVWSKILESPHSELVEKELEQNFLDRYGDKWALSRRNQPGTSILSGDEIRSQYGLGSDKKVAIIFSHILYDTMFFYDDLFESYAQWFVESVRLACENSKVHWFVKIHPSNVWRGELEHYFGGRFEEERLIQEMIGPLPDHVSYIYPDTHVSPYAWMKACDYGITVRGTPGIELGALGKTVITAGAGRYEKAGFTVNPKSISEYRRILRSLPDIAPLREEQRARGIRFAYATFCMKPFQLDFLTPRTRSGTKEIKASDDLVYSLRDDEDSITLSTSALRRFCSWSERADEIDLMSPWPTGANESA